MLSVEHIIGQTDAVPGHRKDPRIDPNQERVKQGWCWWDRKYAPRDVILEELETRARASGIGLWADPHPVPPWEWRMRSR